MQKAARRRRYLRNKQKKAFKRMMLYTAIIVTGLILIWHPVDASTATGGTRDASAASMASKASTVSPSSLPSASRLLSHSSSSTASQLPSSSQSSATQNVTSTTEASAATQNPIDMLNQSFTAIGAKQTGYILHNYSTINHRFTEVKNLSNLGRDFVQELDVQNAKVTQISRADDVFYNIDGFWPNQTEVEVTVSSFRDGPNDGKTSESAGNAGNPTGSGAKSAMESTSASAAGSTTASPTGITTLAVSVMGNGSNNEEIKQQYQMVENVVKKVGITPEMNACLEGYLDDRIVGVQAKAIALKGFAAIHAAPVEGLYTGLETSVSGYTNEFDTNYITTDGKRMNVQLAVHADDYNHRTNVLVGTPIITTTY
jgi:hypothetical protein